VLYVCGLTLPFIAVQRLFVGEPIWTPYNRDEIDEKKDASRKKYIEQFLEPLWTAAGKDVEAAAKRQKVEDARADDKTVDATEEKA
jgi:hypothetical protein